jgi:hypothetical protein
VFSEYLVRDTEMELTVPILEERFRSNLRRVLNLLFIYNQVSAEAQGRPSVQESDLLRAGVVFLHATLEDLLRNLAAWRLPRSTSEVLARIPFVGGDGRRTTLTLGDLAGYRGRSVEEVISASVIAHLTRSSYNDTNDIAKLLSEIELPQDARKRLMDSHGVGLSLIMSRRHQIVHRLDRNDASGRGHHEALSISRATLERWVTIVTGFGLQLLDEVRGLPAPSEAAP